MSSVIGVLYKSRPFLDSKSRNMHYFSLVHSQLLYANIVWASTLKTKLLKLQSLQNHACKVMNYLNRLVNPAPVMKSMMVLDIEKLNTLQILIFMYKYKNNLLPSVFSDTFLILFSEKYNLRLNTRYNYHLGKINSHQPNFHAKFSAKYSIKSMVAIHNSYIKIKPNFSFFKSRQGLYMYLKGTTLKKPFA